MQNATVEGDDDGDVNPETDETFEDMQNNWICDEDMDDAMERSRERSTTEGYKKSCEKFLKWSVDHQSKDIVADVLKEDEEDPTKMVFDVAKLAKSMETVRGPYCQYTRQYQLDMQAKSKSGLGAIKQLRSGLTNLFRKNRVELSQVALATLKNWQKSRCRDDMTAKMRDINPVKFSNARDSLPSDAFVKLAETMAMLLNVQMWVMFVLQWVMLSRVSQVANVMFNFMSWKEDHFVAKHGSSKADKKATRAFPMAIMANRYTWYICPITALAIWMSITVFPEGGNKLFPGSNPASTYGSWLNAFFTDNATTLVQWAGLLLGTHSIRKGGTNRAASEGLVADTLIASLIRGLWDIGDTLQRYFKANATSDSMIARILSGLNPNKTSFRALPPHFVTTPSQLRVVDVAVKNQFAGNPLLKDGTMNVLRHFLASLVHHYPVLNEKLHADHPLRDTWIFGLQPNALATLTALLGPEFEPRVDGEFTITNGIPPTIHFMLQNEEEHAKTRERFETFAQSTNGKINDIQVSLEELKVQNEETKSSLLALSTQGITTVGPQVLQQMMNQAAVNNATESTRIQHIEDLLQGLIGTQQLQLQQQLTPPPPPSNGAVNTDTAPLDSNADSTVALLSTVTTFQSKSYPWTHTDAKSKKKDPQSRLRKLPLGYSLSPSLNLSGVYKRFTTQSGTSSRPIPPLSSVKRPARQFSNPAAKAYFGKANAVYGTMKQLMEKDEAGRTLCAVFDSSKTVDSLNKMCDEAQRRIIGHLPATKSKKKRSRPDAIKAATVYNALKKIKIAAGLRTQKKKSTTNQTNPSM